MKKQIIWILVLLSSQLIGQVSSSHLINSTRGFNRSDVTGASTGDKKHGSTKLNPISPNPDSIPSEADSIEIIFLGSGGLKNLFSGQEKGDNPLTGSAAVTFVTWKSELTLGFTVGEIKEIKVDNAALFGANLINPDLSGSSFSIHYLRLYPKMNKDHYEYHNWGFSIAAQVSNSKWRLNDSTIYTASPLAFKISGVYAPFKSGMVINKNRINATLSLGLNMRYLLGNIANYPDAMINTYGTKQRIFGGLELEGDLHINTTRLFVNLQGIFANKHIDNLTGGQVTIGLKVDSDVLSFKGKKP